ncbi:glycoside hydrolase family 79 protein [Infundibulicybe gibba]|nr:glycoside hydrolase family 79 protein [Infundibulicybe gibba]
MTLLRSFIFLSGLGLAHSASVTVYYVPGQTPLTGSLTGAAAAAAYTGAAAYNPTVLNAPALPNPLPPLQFPIQLQNGDSQLSIQQPGSFFGFSIEMSVANQVLGKNSSAIQVPFLNLMGNLQQRSGGVHIRVGGNTQETAVLVDQISDGRILEKNQTGSSNPTQTPPLIFTRDLLYMMRNISSMVNVHWFLGIPFLENDPSRLGIAEAGQSILGDYLIGLQAGNEPDLYGQHQHRDPAYAPSDYVAELQTLVQQISSDANVPNQGLLIAPNVATGPWTPEMVWDTGMVDTFSSNLAFLAVEHYPADNCVAQFHTPGTPVDPQQLFPSYLDHNAGINIVKPYLNSTNFAQQKNKKLLMFETNTGSCGGFAGISDSFGAALWGLDYAMQMAYSNFSGLCSILVVKMSSITLSHVGALGSSVIILTCSIAPPTNQSTFHQWTVGPIYYSALAMAEAIGPSNTTQIKDLNTSSVLTPAYGIYENGTPVRVALFNYMTDPTGNSNYTASISIGGGTTGQPNGSPAQVKVKYLQAASVSQKGNITWAGQTFGDHFASDGRPQGTEDIRVVQCDQNANTCAINVPAPGFALVFLSDSAQTETAGAPTTTFATTFRTKTQNTATVDPAVLATSNGHSGGNGQLGSTSKGSVSGASGLRQVLPGVSMITAIVAGAWVVGQALIR